MVLLCRIRRWHGPLLRGWKPGEVPAFILMGGCADADDALYVRWLARMPVDVLLPAPNLDKPCALADDTLLEWRSEDESVVTVDPTGRVTAHRGGRTKVYAITPNGIRADADVLVHVSGDAMRLTPEALTVGTGSALKMGTIYFPDDATETVERWITSDPNLLTVDAEKTTVLTSALTWNK